MEWKPHALPHDAEALKLAAVNYTFFFPRIVKKTFEICLGTEIMQYALSSVSWPHDDFTCIVNGKKNVMLIYIRLCPSSCPWKDMSWCHTVPGCTTCSSLSYASSVFFLFRSWRRMIADFVDVSKEQLFQSSWSVLIGMKMQSCSVGKLSLASHRTAGGVRTQPG